MVIGQTRGPQTPTKYVALRTFDIRQTLKRLDIVHELAAAVMSLTALGGAVYQSCPSKEEAVWRTLVADQQVDSKDIWHRPATRHYYLYILSRRMEKRGDSEELLPFSYSARIQLGLDKLQKMRHL
jgi:hypothetical protein